MQSFYEGFEHPVSLTEAILQKYVDEDQSDPNDLYVTTTSQQKKPIELLGAQEVQSKKSRIENLTEIDLQNYKIAHIDNELQARNFICA